MTNFTNGLKRSPLLHGCYQEKSGTCPTCGDDLGDYSATLVTGPILLLRKSTRISHPVDLEEPRIFSRFFQNYQVAWLEFDTATIVKELDLISWRCA